MPLHPRVDPNNNHQIRTDGRGSEGPRWRRLWKLGRRKEREWRRMRDEDERPMSARLPRRRRRQPAPVNNNQPIRMDGEEGEGSWLRRQRPEGSVKGRERGEGGPSKGERREGRGRERRRSYHRPSQPTSPVPQPRINRKAIKNRWNNSTHLKYIKIINNSMIFLCRCSFIARMSPWTRRPFLLFFPFTHLNRRPPAGVQGRSLSAAHPFTAVGQLHADTEAGG